MKRLAATHYPLLVLILVAYWRFLSTWWFHDDWVFLANAAGLEARGNPLVRVVSYQLYWRLLWPLFGLQTWPWAVTRLALHCGSAHLVQRLGRKVGLTPTAAGLASLLFAAHPVAFESLYWGTGAVELLWVFFTLFALERWLAGGARNRWAALGLAALAIGSKETAIILPLLFGWDLWRNQKEHRHWFAVAAVFLLGIAEIYLIFRDVQGTGQYGLVLGQTPENFCLSGAWLLGPFFLLRDPAAVFPWSIILGAVVWAGWGFAALRRFRVGQPWPLLGLIATVAMVLPVAVLGGHMVPRYLYGPVAGFSLFLLGLWPDRLGHSVRWRLAGAGLLTGAALASTNVQLTARWPQGRLVHRLVFKEAVSRAACRQLLQSNLARADRLVLYLGPTTDPGQETILKECLGGDRAILLLLGRDLQVDWVRELGPQHRGACVIPTRGANLMPGYRYDPP